MKHFVSATVLVCLSLLPSPVLMAQPASAFSPTVLNLPGLVAPVDLEEVSFQLGQCLDHPLTVFESQVNGRGDRLAVELEPYGDDAQPGDRFTVSMRYNDAAGRWEPSNFFVIGQMSIPAWEGRSIHVQGLVASEEAEAVHTAINRYWASKLGAEAVRIDSIISSRGPELSCRYDGLEPRTTDVHYNVAASNSSLPTLNELNLPQGRIVDIGSQPLAPLYHFHLRQEGGEGPLNVVRATCDPSPHGCDEQVLAGLQAGRAAQEDPLDDAALRAVMLSSLPPAFRHAEIGDTQTLWRGDRETVVIQLSEVAVSDLRKAASHLQCDRWLSAPAEWECEHRIISFVQSVAGFDLDVRLRGDLLLSQEEVIDLVDKLFARVSGGSPNRLLVRGTREGYHVHFFSNEGRERQAWFSEELELQRLE